MSDLVGFATVAVWVVLSLGGAFTKRRWLRATVGTLLGVMLVTLFVISLVTGDPGLGIAVGAMTVMSWLFLWAGWRDSRRW